MFECREQCKQVLTKAFFGNTINHFRFIEPTTAALLAGGAGLTIGSIFGGSKSKKVKLPPQFHEAMNELLARGKADVKFPTAGVAPLSPEQKQAIARGTAFAGSPVPSELGLASETFAGLTAPGDILDRPEVRGVIGKATEEGNLLLNRAARSIGLRQPGTTAGTPGRDILGRGVTAVQERIAAALSEFLNAAENRKLAAAQGLQGVGAAKDTAELRRVGTGIDLGALTRSIEQQIEDARFQKMINDINFRFQTQPQILSSVLGNVQGTVTGGQPSTFAQASPLIGQLLGAAINAQGAPAITPNVAAGTQTSFAPGATTAELENLFI